jgi:transcriptional regulator GlxA family with amidase domain
MISKKIGWLVFDGFNALDLVGPLEVFTIAKELGGMDYQTTIIGLEHRPYTSESGLSVVGQMSTAQVNQLDTLLIPGGAGSRDTLIQQQHHDWLLSMLNNTRRVVSVCTGAFLLAATGALNHKKATTHWNYTQALKQAYPLVKVVSDSLYIDHGKIATSAGISSGVDLALKLVEKDCGNDIAVQVARFMVIHYRRAGNQAQFSTPLQSQAECNSEFSDLTSWILQHLPYNITVGMLAQKMNMSPRNFSRRFSQQLGESPAKYIELLRLDYARQLLTEKDWHIQRIAMSCGYANADVFRRAFERKFVISPGIYRARFC